MPFVDSIPYFMNENELFLVSKKVRHVKREAKSIIRNFAGGAGIATCKASNENLPYMLHGTGDVYASCVLAAVMAGKGLHEATAFAGDFVHDAMIASAKQPHFRGRGISFEFLLGKARSLLA